MAEYSALKAAINAYIKRNGRQQITGTLLNSILNAVVSSLGAGYQFMGVADGDTEPGTPDARVFYLAPAGDYDNFGGTEVPAGSLGVFCYDTAWSYDVIEFGGGGSGDAVLYVEQALTPEQKAQARTNIGAGTYSKASGGIPKTDLAEGVQTSLEKADSAYQKPNDGIPSTDLAEGVQTSLGKADTAYQKPSSGIPSTDLASPIRASLGKAESAVQPRDIEPIVEVIPSQASESNKLADKNFVNSSIATNTAYYISDNGQPFSSLADLEAYSGTLTNNDYAFVVGTDAAGNTTYTRYKYNASTQEWAEEYVLNNSSFTAAQWAAISSGITALLVQKLSDLPTEVVTYVSQTLSDAQKAQARTNIGATAPEIFWAEYGTTTLADITTAYNAGKVVCCNRGGGTYVLANLQSTYGYFGSLNRTTAQFILLSGTSWSAGQSMLEQTGNKVSTIVGAESNTIKFPNTKAVADFAVQALTTGGKKIWVGTQDDYDLLTPDLTTTIYFITNA